MPTQAMAKAPILADKRIVEGRQRALAAPLADFRSYLGTYIGEAVRLGGKRAAVGLLDMNMITWFASETVK